MFDLPNVMFGLVNLNIELSASVPHPSIIMGWRDDVTEEPKVFLYFPHGRLQYLQNTF